MLRDLAADPDEEGIGRKAREVAQALIEVSTGLRDPSTIDTKAALAILERTDGAVIKERVQHHTGERRIVIQGVDVEPKP